jgi:hypothetical protein
MSMAGGIIFQMDQAASSDQIIFRNFRECGQDANLDCRIGVRAGGDTQKTPRFDDESLHKPNTTTD